MARIIIVVNEGKPNQRMEHIENLGEMRFFSDQFAVRLTERGAEVQFMGRLPKDFQVYTGFTPKSANPSEYLSPKPIGQISRFAITKRGEENFQDEDIRLLVVIK